MKILIVECNAEELRANKTVMDCISDALNKFTENFCGVRIDNGFINAYHDSGADNPYQE